MDGLGILRGEVANDSEMAWALHCNIAMPIKDATGVSHKLANEAAAFLMQHLLSHDITADERYQYKKSAAQDYAEMRIEMERLEDMDLPK